MVAGLEQREEDNILPALTKSNLTIGINAGNMQLYTGGVADPVVPRLGRDHAVLIVGYGTG